MTPAEITDEIIDECWEVLGTDYHFNVEKARTLFRKAIADAKAIGPVRPRKTFDELFPTLPRFEDDDEA